MSWTFINGPCDGLDFVDRWPQIIRVDGLVINDWRIRPWNETPVLIRSFTISKIAGGPHGNVMVGNSYVNDAMVTLGPNETVNSFYTPSGSGVPFPGTSNDPGTAYFDLHGSATGGGLAQFRVDIAYTPQPDAAPVPGAVNWNPSDKGANIVLSGRSAMGGGGVFNAVRATMGRSTGKYKWENQITSVTTATSVSGFATSSMSLGGFVGASAQSCGLQAFGGQTSVNGFTSGAPIGIGFSVGDVMTFAVDLDVHKIWIGKNNTWFGDPVAGTDPWVTYNTGLTLYPAFSSADSANTATARFAASDFTGASALGFLPWDS